MKLFFIFTAISGFITAQTTKECNNNDDCNGFYCNNATTSVILTGICDNGYCLGNTPQYCQYNCFDSTGTCCDQSLSILDRVRCLNAWCSYHAGDTYCDNPMIQVENTGNRIGLFIPYPRCEMIETNCSSIGDNYICENGVCTSEGSSSSTSGGSSSSTLGGSSSSTLGGSSSSTLGESSSSTLGGSSSSTLGGSSSSTLGGSLSSTLGGSLSSTSGGSSSSTLGGSSSSTLGGSSSSTSGGSSGTSTGYHSSASRVYSLL